MGLELRVPTDDDWAGIGHLDGRTFGFNYTDEVLQTARRLIDLSRYRIVTDGAEIVGVAGSYAFDVALPGGAAVPMAGVTWVSVASTHRRRGVLTQLLEGCHADIDARGEPVATLYASESGIYERFGYGVATSTRTTTIATRTTSVQPRFRPQPGDVRFVAGDDAERIVRDLWWRGWRSRAGEVRRTEAHLQLQFERRGKTEGKASNVHYLVHADGYAAYRISADWNDAFTQHEVSLVEMVALTSDARAALWHTLIEMDLVATITSRQLPIDEPLPYLLDNPRAVRTTNLIDGVWVNVRDVAVAFGARTYAIEDRLVVEADGRRWAIEGGPDGGSVRGVRSRPDVITDAATLGALLYGGVRPSLLVAGRRLEARNDAALRRADLFFPTAVAPHCQTMY
jgi:predicted acetyltransferase